MSMNASTRPDVNYLSYSHNGWALYAGSDRMRDGLTEDEVRELLKGLDSIDGSKYASILKITGDGVFFMPLALTITQGNENCVDINNRAKMTLTGTFGHESFQGDQLFSVKAGAWARIIGTIKGSGKRMKADIILDNWSDQNQDGSYLDITELKHETGRKIRIVKDLLKGIMKLGSNAEVLYPQSLGLTLYNITKKLIRLVLRIPNGKKGPSWF